MPLEKIQTWDLPINFNVSAVSEQQAEELINKILSKTITKHGLEDIVSFEFIEYLASTEDNNG